MMFQTSKPHARSGAENLNGPHAASAPGGIEVDPLADIISGTGKPNDVSFVPGGFRQPLWRLLVTSTFGHRLHPVLGSTRFHRGVDYGARTGTPIRAAASGAVIWASDLGPYGTLAVIEHSGGVHTAYGHLESVQVSVGQRVKVGQRIGRVGATGLATGPHLHFEIRDHGSPVNPAPWLTGRSSLLLRAFDAATSKLPA